MIGLGGDLWSTLINRDTRRSKRDEAPLSEAFGAHICGGVSDEQLRASSAL